MPRVRDRMSAECEPRISGRRAAVRTSLRDSASAHRSAAREQASQASATHPQSTSQAFISEDGVFAAGKQLREHARSRSAPLHTRTPPSPLMVARWTLSGAYATGRASSVLGSLRSCSPVAGSQTIAKHWWFTPPYSANESLRVVSGGGYRNTWRSSTPCSRDRARSSGSSATGMTTRPGFKEGRDLDVPYKAFTAQRHVYNAGTTHDEQSVGCRAVRRFPSA